MNSSRPDSARAVHAVTELTGFLKYWLTRPFVGESRKAMRRTLERLFAPIAVENLTGYITVLIAAISTYAQFFDPTFGATIAS